jgi:hypothetical protein
MTILSACLSEAASTARLATSIDSRTRASNLKLANPHTYYITPSHIDPVPPSAKSKDQKIATQDRSGKHARRFFASLRMTRGLFLTFGLSFCILISDLHILPCLKLTLMGLPRDDRQLFAKLSFSYIHRLLI